MPFLDPGMPELRRAFFEGPLRACNILTIIIRIQSLFAAVPRCFKEGSAGPALNCFSTPKAAIGI
jgi:hypothetical protein